MILSYSKDSFEADIKSGIKIHTIRADPKRRWKVGMAIQHWRGNPRNVRQKPHHFANGICKGIQEIRIFNIFNDRDGVRIDGVLLTPGQIDRLARNDGFKSVDEFWEWFGMQDFVGVIIQFTDFKY
jgi:hypothetical protein